MPDTRLPLRVRALDVVLRRVVRFDIASMDDESILRSQKERVASNRVTRLITGRPAPGVTISTGSVVGASGDVPVRLYRSDAAGGALPVVLNFHGGGWTLGSPEQGDWWCSEVAAQVPAVVLSVQYRLAPSHRYPCAVEDCYAAYEAVCAGLPTSFAGRSDPGRVAVMGDSAGGNLAAVVALMARDRAAPPLRSQVLLYPGTDLTQVSAAGSLAENAYAPILTRRDVDAFSAHYLGSEGDPREAYASPMLASSHTGLPPALVQVASHDPIRDDGIAYARVLRGAGVPVRLTEYARVPHGYASFPGIVPMARQALHEAVLELRERLAS